jgi:hypothetical protein
VRWCSDVATQFQQQVGASCGGIDVLSDVANSSKDLRGKSLNYVDVANVGIVGDLA